MKAFRFRLQAVLTLREQDEQVAQQHCARANEALECAKTRLRSADAMIAAADGFRREQLAAGVRADQFEQLRAYGLTLRERRAQLARELSDAERLVEAAARRLVLATQRREVLERLRERQRRAYDYHTARAEQKLLDETSGRAPNLLDHWSNAVPV